MQSKRLEILKLQIKAMPDPAMLEFGVSPIFALIQEQAYKKFIQLKVRQWFDGITLTKKAK